MFSSFAFHIVKNSIRYLTVICAVYAYGIINKIRNRKTGIGRNRFEPVMSINTQAMY